MDDILKNEVIRLINLKTTSKQDVKSMITIVRNNFDPKFNVCTHCVAQIKFAQNQLLNWYNSLPQEEPIPQPQEVVKEPGCSKCKKKITNKK